MDIPSWAKPGVKVVCINARPTAFADPMVKYDCLHLDGLTAGATYTIRRTDIDWYDQSTQVLFLSEIHRPLRGESKETGFAIARFRPLTTRTQSQDVALFKSLLTDIREGADV